MAEMTDIDDDKITYAKVDESEEIPYHRHCQKTVLSAYGTDGQGKTWDVISRLESELQNLKGEGSQSWIELFKNNNGNITEDIASLLKTINLNCHHCDCNVIKAKDLTNPDQAQIIANIHIYRMSSNEDFAPQIDLSNYIQEENSVIRFEYHITNSNASESIVINEPEVINEGTDWTISCFTDDNEIPPKCTSIFVFRADKQKKLLEYGLAYKQETMS